MSKIVPVSGPLSVETIAAAQQVAASLLSQPHPEAAGLTRWMLGDDLVPLRTMTAELGLCVEVLKDDATRSDMRQRADAILRRLSGRYRLDASCGAVDVGSVDDAPLRSPEGYERLRQDVAAKAA